MFTFKYKNYHFECSIGTMTPNQYIKMIKLLEDNQPNNICELGSGQSTRIFDTYKTRGDQQISSIEDNTDYLTKYTILSPVSIGELKINEAVYNNIAKYDVLECWLQTKDKFDFVFIDGPNDVLPFNNNGLDYSRIQLLSFVLLDKLDNDAVVLYHDSERQEAQATLNEFERLLSENNFKYQKEVIIEDDKEIYNYNKDILGTCPELTIYKLNKNDSRTKDKEEESLGGTY